MAQEGASGVRALLSAGGFRRLLVGQAVSGLGDWVATLALIALAFDLTKSQTAVAVVLVLRLVPPIFAAPVGGLLADRLDRRMVMVTVDLARAALIVLVPFASIGLIYVIAFVHESISLLFLPARDASVPLLIRRKDLPLANGLILASSFGSIPFAAALFGGLRLLAENVPSFVPFSQLVRDHPTSFAFFFDAATFVVSAAMIAGISIPRNHERRSGPLLEGVTEGFRYAWRSPTLRSLGVGLVVSMFGGGVLFAIGIAYVRETLGGGDVEFGWLAALWGAGMGIGVGTVRFIVHRGESYVFVLAVLLCGGILIVMAFLPYLWLAFIAAVAFGAAFSVAIMVAMSLAQAITEDRIRGRVMGGVQMLFRVGLGADALGMGALATSITHVSPGIGRLRYRLDGNQVGLLVGGILILLGAVSSAGIMRSPGGTSPPQTSGPD